MDIILYYIRDNIVSVHYFIYAFVCLFLMFAIIGYLFKQKYAKLTINVNSSQQKKEVNEEKVVNQINTNATMNNHVSTTPKPTNLTSQATPIQKTNLTNQNIINQNNISKVKPINASSLPNSVNVKPVNTSSINNQTNNIPEVKPMPTNPNNQIRPTITPNNNNQVNPVNLNNQTK